MPGKITLFEFLQVEVQLLGDLLQHVFFADLLLRQVDLDRLEAIPFAFLFPIDAAEHPLSEPKYKPAKKKKKQEEKGQLQKVVKERLLESGPAQQFEQLGTQGAEIFQMKGFVPMPGPMIIGEQKIGKVVSQHQQKQNTQNTPEFAVPQRVDDLPKRPFSFFLLGNMLQVHLPDRFAHDARFPHSPETGDQIRARFGFRIAQDHLEPAHDLLPPDEAPVGQIESKRTVKEFVLVELQVQIADLGRIFVVDRDFSSSFSSRKRGVVRFTFSWFPFGHERQV